MIKQAREQMETLIALITKVRNIRSRWNIPQQSRLKLYIGTGDQSIRDLVSDNEDQIKASRASNEISMWTTCPHSIAAARDIVAGMEIAVPLEGLIDSGKGTRANHKRDDAKRK